MIKPCPMVNVYKVDSDRLNTDNGLACLWFRFRNIFVGEDLGPSMLMHSNRFHNAVTLG